MRMDHPKILHNLGCISIDLSSHLEDISYFFNLSLFFTLAFYRLMQVGDMRVNLWETLNILLFLFYKLSLLACILYSVFAPNTKSTCWIDGLFWGELLSIENNKFLIGPLRSLVYNLSWFLFVFTMLYFYRVLA